MDRYLIVGLGNPGRSYENTRHNIGFAVVDWLAETYHLSFRSSLRMQGQMAKKEGEEKEIWLFKPTTYMNLSGRAVGKLVRDKGIELSQVLIIADDVHLPFGKLRLRAQGSSGGHNGLESIEESLATQEYARLRIGVGAPDGEELSDFVLGKFSQEETGHLPNILEKAGRTVEIWLEQGILRAMDAINRSPSNPSNGEKQDE